ncbi:DeoR family transcriptional regulator [Actinosynnema sp. NPDC023658]|uniref:DeoR family transcriptional regulator n=1 Tax=Actinosynnema sp. NPDC023658 TaxID=3155465 RepID=UPI0033FC05B0
MRHANDVGRRNPAPVRRQQIVNALAERGFLTIPEIQAATRASAATIRRDLLALSGLGRLIRVHGGALACPPRPHVPTQRNRSWAAENGSGRQGEVIGHVLTALAAARQGDLQAAEASLYRALETCRRLRRSRD